MQLFSVTAITCITAQNTKKIRKISKVSPNLVEEQILSFKEDFKISAVKIGMLYDKEVMLKVSKCIKLLKDIPIIVDPVMISKSGDYLLKPSAINFFKKEILPKAWLVTPNLHEALNLSGIQTIQDEKDIKNCCIQLNKFGAENILIKGGHLKHKKEVVDYLFHNNKIYKFTSSRYNTKNTHGTGGTLSSALATCLSQKKNIVKSCNISLRYVDKAIVSAPGFGKGFGPLNHLVLINSRKKNV